MQISDATVLISGASSGLGEACAKRFLAGNAKVAMLDLRPPKDGSLLANYPDHCRFFAGDVTSESDIARAVSEIESEFGNIAVAVTCAGILHSERCVGKEGPASLSAFSRVLEVNLIGTFNVVRLAAASMCKCQPSEKDGERGVIVMTSSIAAFDGQVGQAAYAASKGGVASMTLPLARELGRMGIRVVSVAPGVFETPMMQVAPDKVRQSLLDCTPFPNRFGEPSEFAQAVEHVVTNAMFNGSTLRLDAGLRMPVK